MPCSASECDSYPFEIGTNNGCKYYNVYYKRSEVKKIGVTTTTTTDASEDLGIYTGPLYSGIYNPNLTPIPIGYFTILGQSTLYSPGAKVVNTLRYNFFWIENNTLAASISADYNYLGASSQVNIFFPPNSIHYFNSITCDQQLLNNKAGFKLVVDSANEIRQIRIKIKCHKNK